MTRLTDIVSQTKGTLTNTEKINIKRTFRILDHNHDGKICPKDLQKVLITKGIRLPLSEAEDMIWECDDMRVGALHFEDLTKLYLRRKGDKGISGTTPRLFSLLLYMLFDKDDDGDVTPEEMFSYGAVLGASSVDIIVDSISKTGISAATSPDQFIRLMQSKIWTTRNGDGTLIVDLSKKDKPSEEDSTKPYVSPFFARKPTAKDIYEMHTRQLKAKAGENALKKSDKINHSTMRRTRNEALEKALYDIKEVPERKKVVKVAPIKPSKPTFPPKKRTSIIIGADMVAPGIGDLALLGTVEDQKKQEIDLVKQREQIAKIREKQKAAKKQVKETDKTVIRPPGMPPDDQIVSWFQEHTCCDKETQEMRAFARKVGLELKVADQALEKFHQIDTDGNGVLNEEEFHRYLQKFMFNENTPVTFLKSCWKEVSQVYTDDGSQVVLQEISFLSVLQWYAKRFKDADFSKPPTQDIYTKLGKNRLSSMMAELKKN